jgi:hypothetical protein
MAKFLNRFKLPMLSSSPSPTPEEAEMWYESATGHVKFKGSSDIVSMHTGTRFADYATGRWYMTQTGMSTATALVNNRCYATPFVIPRLATLSGTAVEVTTAWATTAGNVRVGIYSDSSRMPGTLLSDFGQIAATVGVKVYSNTYSFTQGWYWLVMAMQGGAGTAGQIRTVQGQHEFISDSAATPNMNGNMNCFYSDTGFSGALPSSFGAVAGMVAGPRFAVRFSA